MFSALDSGGLFAIYNLYPKQVEPDQGYLTWATGDCPWTESAVKAAGFEVLAFNVNDDRAVRAMTSQLGWHEEPQSMDLENNLFATFTILRKP
ncbi:MAG: hypothetical protein ACI8TQ_001503 [Planctomycetota bacterium]|jgi:hypothetical protein